MPWRLSFLQKLLLLTIAPLAMAQTITMFLVTSTAEREVLADAKRDLGVGGEVVGQFLRSRQSDISRTVEVLSSDFALREVLATADAPSIRSALDNHAQRIGADFGAFIALDQGTPVSTREALMPVISEGASRREQTSVSVQQLGDTSFQIVAAPVRAPTTIGHLTFGFRIDQRLTDKLQSLTGVNVTVAQAAGAEYRSIAASTIDDIVPRAILRIAAPSDTASMVKVVGEGRDRTLVASLPLVAGQADATLLLYQQTARAMAPYHSAERTLLSVGFGLLGLVALVSAWLASTFSGRLSSLTTAAERVARGDYEATLHVRSDDELARLASSFSRMQSAIADREAQIRHHATHDPLTDLPNQRGLLEAINTFTTDPSAGCGLLSVTLARMDNIASSLGQTHANTLLCNTAKLLQAYAPEDSFVAHTGTDEFALLLPGADVTTATAVATALDQRLGAGVPFEATQMPMHAHIGVAAFPSHGEDADTLLRSALVARADALTSNKSVSEYRCGRQDHFTRRLQVINDLPRALAQGEIQVYYQPKIDLRKGALGGAEALARWIHPTLGFLAPDEFIGAAEESGAIVHLTRYMIEAVIADLAEWKRPYPHLRVAVNLSTQDVTEGLPEFVASTLREHGVDGSALALEVTESSVMEDITLARTVLQALQALSVHVAIDDFGTGHSSLAHLKALPLDELKIDQAFVRELASNPQDELIVRTTIDLAHSMNLLVVAEGVEDEYSVRTLAGLDCDYVQGYFFSKPVPRQDFERWADAFEPIDLQERRRDARPFSTAG
ncbi:MAG: EAL domain-containing protein [Pseudomonadota bacterium]